MIPGLVGETEKPTSKGGREGAQGFRELREPEASGQLEGFVLGSPGSRQGTQTPGPCLCGILEAVPREHLGVGTLVQGSE